MAVPLENLSRERLTALTGQAFTMEVVGGRAVTAKLQGVVSLGYTRPLVAGGRESFSFTLLAETSDRLAQGIYPLHHPTLGTVEVFLVPVAQNAQGLQLEAIFNFA